MHFLSVIFISTSLFGFVRIDKNEFYKDYESNDQKVLANRLSTLQKQENSTQKDAYSGALKMKISQFKPTPKEKIELFKAGKTLLENAIKKSPDKIEFYFLRLTIQENSPKMLKYQDQINVDAQKITAGFSELDSVLKKVIIRYAANSSSLDANQLN